MKIAYVALGSNLQDPTKQVQQAFVALTFIKNTRVLKKSSLYQTAPIGYLAEKISEVPDFINAVVSLETDLTPLELLDALLDIESLAGRERPYLNAPRVLDCDLLMYDNTIINTKKLTLPHPRMHMRGFVLLPLFEIAPHLSIPNHGKIATLITPKLSLGVQKFDLHQPDIKKL
ncbi:MAG: 2-amino-4-hydroxy-6-hydroxymethyldihydropteridine diphosphokinase [Methylotenera sp.]|nr:2-amino-4-hydroxy-6-hydroxymethyldihydropteridine diphosphokinase [Methylotenera sp.]